MSNAEVSVQTTSLPSDSGRARRAQIRRSLGYLTRELHRHQPDATVAEVIAVLEQEAQITARQLKHRDKSHCALTLTEIFPTEVLRECN